MIAPRILVAGVGNIFLRDDAFGVEVVHQLSRRNPPECVKITDFGIRGFDLVYTLLDDYDLTIIVDSAPRGGPPGTLYKTEPDLSEIEGMTDQVVAVEPHGMELIKVFSMVKSMGGTFRRIVVVGCEPGELAGEEDGYLGLSAAVSAAADEAVTMVESTIREALDDNAVRKEGETKTEDRWPQIAARDDCKVEASKDGVLKLVGGVVAALAAWAIIANLPDIKRYIRITTM